MLIVCERNQAHKENGFNWLSIFDVSGFLQSFPAFFSNLSAEKMEASLILFFISRLEITKKYLIPKKRQREVTRSIESL